MNNEAIINIAKQYLIGKNIDFVEPGVVNDLSKTEAEVVFNHPLWDDPDYIVCPDEYRVIVNLNTGIAKWGFQM